MRKVFIVHSIILFSMFLSCNITKQKNIAIQRTIIDCEKVQSIFEDEILNSCPIFNGPIEVIKYLDSSEVFIRNKEYDYGNGSVRFNAKNAILNNIRLVDKKSLFLLNYNVNNNEYSSWSLFQVIYYFENIIDKNHEYERMLKIFSDKLKLKKEIYSDILGNSYNRYTLPCGSKFNIKHGMNKGLYVIDIVWIP